MTGALAGRVVLVTGGGRGIGAEISYQAALAGAVVAVNYGRSHTPAKRTVQRINGAGGEAEEFGADVSQAAQVDDLVQRVIGRFGRIDALVNNAGVTQVDPFFEIDESHWNHVIATNLTAAFLMCKAVLPGMVGRGSGSIVNIASRLGQMGIAETAAYSASKAGLIGLTRSLAKEFGPKGVRINAVAPGPIETEMTTDLLVSEEGARRLRDLPLGRFGRPEEVANAVIFLISDAASLFTGQTLNPNSGGYMP